MVNVTVKEVTNPVAGQDDDHLGGTDANQIAQILKGTHSTERIQSSSIQAVTWVTKTTSPVTLLNTEEFVLADVTSNAIIINLPTAIGNLNGHFCIKKVGSALNNLVTVDAFGTETIEGKLTITIDGQGELLDVVSDGSNWRVTRIEKVPWNAFRVKGATLNRWYSNEILDNTVNITAVPVAGQMYAFPMLVSRITIIDSIAINVVVGGAASSVNVGLYADNGNMYPATLIQDFGNQATTASGVKLFTTGLPLVLTAGLYWLVFLCSATAPTVTGWTATQLPPILGIVSTLVTAVGGIGWVVAQAAGSLPSTFTASGTIVTAVPCPAVFYRVSG